MFLTPGSRARGQRPGLFLPRSQAREKISAARILYVNGGGSDDGDGSESAPLKTIARAIAAAVSLDSFLYDVTIDIANGTWTESLTLPRFLGSGRIILLGDPTTPSNVTLSVTSNHCLNLTGGLWKARGIKFTTTTSGRGVYGEGYGSIIELDAC